MKKQLSYRTMNEFPLKWRFAEDASKWTVLPPQDLKFFRPFNEDSSSRLWNQHVANDANDLMQIVTRTEPPNRDQFGTRIMEIGEDWTTIQEQQRLNDAISRHITIEPTAQIYFFWNATCAVETNWDILSRYWSDFCYPSDYSNVAVIPQLKTRIYYIESVVWLGRDGSSSIA